MFSFTETSQAITVYVKLWKCDRLKSILLLSNQDSNGQIHEHPYASSSSFNQSETKRYDACNSFIKQKMKKPCRDGLDQALSCCIVFDPSARTSSRTLSSISNGIRNVIAVSYLPLFGVGAKFTAVKRDKASHSEAPCDEELEGL